MTHANPNKNHTFAREVASNARASAVVGAANLDKQIYDILIEAGILELSIDGDYKIETDNYYGSFNVVAIPVKTGTPPGSKRK